MSTSSRRLALWVVVAATVLIVEAGASAQEQAQTPVRYGQTLGSRLVVQEEMGRWLSNLLTQVSDPHLVLVTVDLEYRGQLREVVDKQVQPPIDMQLGVKRKLKLPGLPVVNQKLGARGMSVKLPGRQSVKVSHELDTIVEKITLHMFVEEDMPEAQVDRARTLAAALAGIEPERGDAIEVVELSSIGGPSTAASSGGLELWDLVVICGTVLLSFVLLAVALGARRGSGPSRMVGEFSGVGGTQQAGADGSDAEGVTSPTGETESEDAAQKMRVFGFFSKATQDEQVYLLTHIDPGAAAVVIDRVEPTPEVTRRLFEQLPEDRQLAIALALSEPIVVPTADIERLEEVLLEQLKKSRANVTVGGQQPLASMLQEVPETARNALLTQLNERDATLVEQLRDKMVLFEDITSFPKESIRQVVTDLDPQITALALRGAPASVRDAVLAAVSRRQRAVLEAETDGLEHKSEAEDETARRALEQAMRKSKSGVSWV